MVKRVLFGILCCLVIMCAVPAKILAAPQSAGGASELIALAASSRFAAPTDEELEIQKMSERRREELREKRRQWQNQTSEAAVEEAEQERAAKEAAEKKLNLEKMAEKNPVTN